MPGAPGSDFLLKTNKCLRKVRQDAPGNYMPISIRRIVVWVKTDVTKAETVSMEKLPESIAFVVNGCIILEMSVLQR